RLYFPGGAIDVAVHVELQNDPRRALARAAAHGVDPGNHAQGTLQRRRYAGRHDLRACTRQRGADHNDGEIHVRQRRHRQQAKAHAAQQHDRQAQQHGCHGALDEGAGERRLGLGLPRKPAPQPIKVQIDDRGGEQRQHLADQQAADHDQAQWLAQLGPGAGCEHQGYRAEQRGQGGHENRPEAQQRRFIDGGLWVDPAIALSIEGEVDHHDRVLFDDADQQNDADDGDHAQVVTAEDQRQQSTDGRRRQGREDGDGMDVALVQHAQHDVHRDDGREHQQQRAGERRLERFGRALKLRLHTDRHADVFLHLLDDLHRLAQRNARCQVERHHHRRELPDMGNGQLRLALFDPGQTRQLDLTAVSGLDVDLLKRLGTELTA
nr:hypothetical protein [Tanacetum cinerariifolium]